MSLRVQPLKILSSSRHHRQEYAIPEGPSLLSAELLSPRAIFWLSPSLNAFCHFPFLCQATLSDLFSLDMGFCGFFPLSNSVHQSSIRHTLFHLPDPNPPSFLSNLLLPASHLRLFSPSFAPSSCRLPSFSAPLSAFQHQQKQH